LCSCSELTIVAKIQQERTIAEFVPVSECRKQNACDILPGCSCGVKSPPPPSLLSSKDNQDSARSLQTITGCKKTTGTTTTTTTVARTMPDKTPKMGKKFGEKV
jgi:hypothetical protein